MKNVYRIFFLLLFLIVCNDAFAGREKVISTLGNYVGKHEDYLFEYVGLMGVLAFLKAVSW